MVATRTDTTFRCQPLADLTRQLLFAPPDKRADFVRRAEKLHDQIDPQQTYPFDFVCYRITGYHAERDADTLLVGEAMLLDLRQMIDQLSRSVRIDPRADPEPLDTVESLARKLNVSTKTVRRWRNKGLRWRWVQYPEDRRRRIAFTASAVEHFLAEHGDLVEYAGQFQHMSDAQRKRLLDRARRLAAAADVTLNRVAQHLAEKSGWSLQTIRQLLEEHDRRHPGEPIFADRTGPLTVRQRRLIARAYRMGVPVTKLARRFNRTRSTIYRAIHRRRAAALRRLPIEYIESPTFQRDDADEVLLRGLDTSMEVRSVSAAPIGDLPEPMRPIFRQPTLADADQHRTAVQMNYLKYKAARLRDTLDRYEPRAADIRAIETWLQQAAALRRRLIRVNLPTVLTIARQHLTDMPPSAQKRALLMELLESGVDLLPGAVDAFNPFRGRSLPRHLSWTLMRRFAKSVAAEPQMAAWARKATGRAHRRDEGALTTTHIRSTLETQGVQIET